MNILDAIHANMLFLFVGFILGFCFITAQSETCFNATRMVENGHLVCDLIYPGSYAQLEYVCDLRCVAGYQGRLQLPIMCLDGRPDSWKYSEDNLPKVFNGTWTTNLETHRCYPPTSCLAMSTTEYPRNGKVKCTTEGQESTCLRICSFPYTPAQPDFVNEHCGPETKFFWSNVLRNNETRMPPCVVQQRCDDVEKSLRRPNGHFECQEEPWMRTRICHLLCDFGSFPTNSSNETFCGPSTAYRWSDEWARVRSVVGRLAECKRAPVKVVVTAAIPCDRQAIPIQAQRVANHLKLLEETQGRKIWELVSWQHNCVTDDNNTQLVNFYFNVKDICNQSTCRDACSVFKLSTPTNCNTICYSTFDIYDITLLRQMRNVTLHHIANILSTEGRVAADFGEEMVQSMRVDVDDDTYPEVDSTYQAYNAPGSPYC